MWNLYETQISVSVNKVLLAHPFIYCCLWLLSVQKQQTWGVVRETLWPEKPEMFTAWLFTERKCGLLAFVQRFLALFLLNLENGKLLMEIRGWGMVDLGCFFSHCLSLESLWVGSINFWRSQLQLLKVTAPTRGSVKYKTLSLATCLHLLPTTPHPSRPRAANVPPCSKALGTIQSCAVPHSASTSINSPFGMRSSNGSICW